MTPQAALGEWSGREDRVVRRSTIYMVLRGSGAIASEGEGRALRVAGAGRSPTLPAHQLSFDSTTGSNPGISSSTGK
jgi:hypothetical protein